jgi:type I restriction enzyme S subunit
MNNWKKTTLGEVIEVLGGGTPKTSLSEYWNGGIYWLSVKDIVGNNKYVYNTEKKITDKGLKNSSTRLLAKDDIIISARGTVGELAMIPYPMAFNQSCYGIRGICDRVEQHFLYYLLLDSIHILKQNTHGAVFDTITKETFNRIEFNLPPLDEQKRIADVLSALDDKIEINNKINENLEAQAQAIFKQWFVDFEFPDEEGKPYKSNGGKFIDSELGKIPEGWKVGRLGDIVKVIDNRGKTPPLSEIKTEYPIIDVRALNGSSRFVDYNNCMKFVNNETYNYWFRNGHPKENDILISTVGSLAEMKIFTGNIGAIAQNVVALRPEISTYYLYQYLLNIKSDLLGYDIGSVQPSIKVTHIIKHPILIPSYYCISMFDKIIKSVSNKISNNHKEITCLSEIRDNLLPKLMSGEVRV